MPNNGIELTTLFWLLVSFAMNSMNESSGLVLGADAHVSFQLRVSSIVCAIDMIDILGMFTYYAYRTGSFVKAQVELIR